MDLFEIRGSHTRQQWSHVKQATINNVNTSIFCTARKMFSAWSQLHPWSAPRLAGSSSPAILRLEAVVSNFSHIQRINGSMFLHGMLWEGHDVGPCHEGPRLRVGCAATSRWQCEPKTRTSVRMGRKGRDVFHDASVKARGSDPKCVSAQYGRVVVIVTFAGTCQKIDCRQDGYKEDVQTGVTT